MERKEQPWVHKGIIVISETTHSINISGNNIIDPCTQFPIGLKVGDAIQREGGGFGTVVSKEEWAGQRGPDDFTDEKGLCYLCDEKHDGYTMWRGSWDWVQFFDRPIRSEDNGQLLMF